MQEKEKKFTKKNMRCVDENSLATNYFYLPFDSK